MFLRSSPLIRGSLLGAVVGNCIGGPYEFHNPSTVKEILINLNELGKRDSANSICLFL